MGDGAGRWVTGQAGRRKLARSRSMVTSGELSQTARGRKGERGGRERGERILSVPVMVEMGSDGGGGGAVGVVVLDCGGDGDGMRWLKVVVVVMVGRVTLMVREYEVERCIRFRISVMCYFRTDS